MALKPVVSSLEEVPEALRSEYEQKGDGKYHLKIEGEIPGMVPKAKVDEFRENNIKTNRELEELKAKYKDIDPVKYNELVKQQQELKDKQLIDAGKIDEVVAQRTERMRQEHKSQLEALQAANQKLEQRATNAETQLSTLVIDSAITKEINSVGNVRKGAMQDILNRAKQVFVVEDGKPVAKNGDTYLYGKDGKERLTVTEWSKDLLETSPFLFETSNGGGSSGNGDKGGAEKGATVIRKDDRAGFSNNIENIAAGKTVVK